MTNEERNLTEVRITVSDEALEALKEIAEGRSQKESREVTLEEVVTDMLSREKVIQEELLAGARLVIARTDNTLQELTPA